MDPTPAVLVRRVALPDARPVPEGPWGDIDAVEGTPPGLEHPRGTVIVAQASAEEPSPAVTEWDVATGGLVRSAVLPWPATEADLRIARTGNALHVVAARGSAGSLVYARLTSRLQIEQVETLGAGERARMATDGHVVAILWSGTREGDASEGGTRGWQLITLDAFGRRLGAMSLLRTNVSTFIYGQPLAVVDGNVFVLLPNGALPTLLRLGPDLGVRAVQSLPWSPDDARLMASDGRVLFTDDCAVLQLWPERSLAPAFAERLPGRAPLGRSCPAFDAVADGSGRYVTSQGDVLSADLRVKRHFSGAGDMPDAFGMRPLWLFGRPALLGVDRNAGRAWLAWMDGETLPSPAPSAATGPVARLAPVVSGSR